MAELKLFPPQNAANPDRPLPAMRRGWRNLTTAFVRGARLFRTKDAGIDGTDAKGNLNYGDMLERAVALSRVLGRHFGDAENVGVLLPPTPTAVLGMVSTTIAGKTAVNLSYALKADDVNGHIRKAGIKQIVTSKAFMEKMKSLSTLEAEYIYLEDLKDEVTGFDKFVTGVISRFTPTFLLGIMMWLLLPGARRSADSNATIMFTSGSTGEPKGVKLTHRNVLSEILSITAHVDLVDDEIIMGALPFFHSFGFILTWTSLTLGKTMVYYPNALDVRTIAQLIQQYKVTLMASTPTLMRGYLTRATKEQFASVRMLLLGSEKLKAALAADIEQKLGLTPVEAYGATECSAGISSCVPRMVKTPDGREVWGVKIGSAGQAMPGITIAIVDLNTGELIPRQKSPDAAPQVVAPADQFAGPFRFIEINGGEVVVQEKATMGIIWPQDDRYAEASKQAQQAEEQAKALKVAGAQREGLIVVHGPTVMAGYLDMPKQTAEVLSGSWYITGDIGFVDEDGFLWITDRLSQFAKVAGEMVPLIKVSNAIRDVTGTNEMTITAVAVPDTTKGERIAVVYTKEVTLSPAEVCSKLKEADTLPALWLPKANDFVLVDAFPTGATGKLDLKELKAIAAARLK